VLYTVRLSETLAICLPKRTDGATPRTVRHTWAGVLSVSQPRQLVWNFKADYLCDPALELNRFRRQLKTLFLFAHY